MYSERTFSDLMHPTPKQLAAFAAVKAYDFVLYGGAAGGGKSYFLRWCAIALLLGWVRDLGLRGVRVGLFCEDYPALHDRQLSKIPYEFPAWLGKYNAQAHEYTLAPRFGGGVICFRNLDDPSKYVSSEFAAILVDELTRNNERMFHDLRSRRRWPGIERPKFIGATNPMGIGHAWVKRFWIDREFPPEMTGIADQFVLVPATAADNPHISPAYLADLKTLPPDLARALAAGDWDLFLGQVFQEFRRELHVVAPFTIPKHWRRWGSNDPGSASAGVWHWYAADEQRQVYVYRELTCKRSTAFEQAKEVARLSEGELLDFWVTGMDAFGDGNIRDGKSIVSYYEQGGLVGFRRPRTDRQLGVMTVHEALRPIVGLDGQPAAKLRIFSTCPKLIATLPTLVHDEKDPEVVADSDDDHWYDSLRYGLGAWHANRSEPQAKTFPRGSMGDLYGTPKTLADAEEAKRLEHEYV
jgi:phage terminase large subunit